MSSLSITHQLFYINSTDRGSGTDANFTYDLDIRIDQGFDTVCVLAASIPKSYYLVQLGFNTFTLQEGEQQVVITVPPGNYSYLSWMVVLPNLLNTASPNRWTYQMSYPNRLTQPDTGLFNYTVTANTSQPSFITTENVYEQLGFNPNTTSTFSSNSLQSTNVINFSQEESIFLHSDICINKGNDILQDIYDNNSPPMSFIVFENFGNLEAYSKDLAHTSSRSFNFSVQDENGRILSLNGRNMLITLVAYRKENITEIGRKLVKAHMNPAA
jgi:hypothetical protein